MAWHASITSSGERVIVHASMAASSSALALLASIEGREGWGRSARSGRPIVAGRSRATQASVGQAIAHQRSLPSQR